MKRILMLTGLHVWSLGSKKGASSFYQTLKGYSDHGYEVDLITCNRMDGLDIREVSDHHWNQKTLRKLGHIPKIGYIFRFLMWFAFQVYAVCVGLRLARRRRPTVLYAYEIAGVPVALLLGKLFGLPVVSRFQGTIMKPLMASVGWRLRYWDHWLGLRARANLVIMANDGTQGDVVLDALGVPRNTVRFWLNGVDVHPVQRSLQELAVLRKRLGISSDTLVLLAVSRLVAWKRVERIIFALPEVIRDVPEARLVIVGDGEARVGYERLVRKLNIGDHVLFTGAVPQSDVAEYMAIADIFVSLYDLSNVGNPLLESMALGKCIVTLNNGGTGSIVTHDANGVLIEPDALDRLPATVVALLLDSGRRLRLGRAAQEYARNSFWNWDDRMNCEIAEVERLSGGLDNG